MKVTTCLGLPVMTTYVCIVLPVLIACVNWCLLLLICCVTSDTIFCAEYQYSGLIFIGDISFMGVCSLCGSLIGFRLVLGQNWLRIFIVHIRRTFGRSQTNSGMAYICYLKWARSALRDLWLEGWGSSC